ncbi:unnamed protein product [Peniophora sp. CBMAI 1063]|nr:unnamed protein product [Peniophora sp. CBMAI 1063]
MSSKRKWDEAAPDGSATPESAPKVAKSEESRDASTAAAAAAAIAAKIAAQFSAGGAGGIGGKDPHDGDFVKDIDINDQRNRYLLTKGSTQQQIHDETGASVGTKGTWYPDRSKATERDPPLYLHISATTQEMLDKAVAKVNELINLDMGSLVEDKSSRGRERRKWPEEKVPVGIESLRNFNVRAKVVGPTGMFVKYIQQETGTRVQIKGLGSGFVDQETGRESDEPMHIHITGPDENMIARAKLLADDLLEVVRGEHAKALQQVQAQQMELHHAQMQYAAYTAAMSGGYAPQPPGSAPPPPPGEQPPPPPDGSAQQQQSAAPLPSDTDAYAAYWAAYGYDVNSPEFKQWQAQQQAQYAQYYAQQGYTATPNADGSAAATPAPPPPSDAAPPPPPPGPPPS